MMKCSQSIAPTCWWGADLVAVLKVHLPYELCSLKNILNWKIAKILSVRPLQYSPHTAKVPAGSTYNVLMIGIYGS